ncbi:MAG TPA: MBL fold metallo-hydrolase, partial [Rhodothermales bacterium]|nr:MBL fold metallo-hydrolase [Rhodothermales bacterium]
MANLTIQIMDVGQGDGIFVVFPDGTTMLVDYGSTKNKALVSDDSLKYFKNNTKFASENQTLDYLILTHGDIDHYNMVKSFCEKLKANV